MVLPNFLVFPGFPGPAGFPGRSGFPVVLAIVSDPDSVSLVDPYPDPDPGRQKFPTKIDKNIKKFHFFKR